MTRMRSSQPALVLSVLLFISQALGQSKEFKGLVRDINTQQAISHVNIFYQGTMAGVTSDHAGRFSILISTRDKTHLIFKHIAYDSLVVDTETLFKSPIIYLQPRVIPLKGVTKEESRLPEIVIEKDIPQSISLIDSKSFEFRGYVDAGDLLRTDHSIQVDENLSGRKTASIRGGNPDELVVLYHGVKMNDAFDNVFDFSSVDLTDVERFEIIRGSNTALYGPDAFSGVINIVPRFRYDYKIRFQQRFGTYRSGNWGLQLSHEMKRISGTYSVRRGRMIRDFAENAAENHLENESTYHTANLNYSLSQKDHGSPENKLQLTAIYSISDYENQVDGEGMGNKNGMISLKYIGKQYSHFNFNTSGSYRKNTETQNLTGGLGEIHRDIKNDWFEYNIDETVKFGILEWLNSYQYQLSKMDFSDQRQIPYEMALGLESAKFKRKHHGFVSILKIKEHFPKTFIKSIELNGSLRKDWVSDRQEDHVLRITAQDVNDVVPIGYFGENSWEDLNYKFAMKLEAYRNDMAVNTFISFGTNTKFPTLFQQISSPLSLTGEDRSFRLKPEKARSVEVNIAVTRDVRETRSIFGWQIAGTFFQNHYSSKLRASTVPDIPVMFYDNVDDARITGFETQVKVYFLRKKMSLDWGMSRYDISEKAAFPFKSDYKHTVTLQFNYKGYSFRCHWFQEGEQTAWIRQITGEFAEVSLPPFENLDLHLGKTFQIGKFKIFSNISGRNLLNDSDLLLRGLALRDRRLYLTIGSQY